MSTACEHPDGSSLLPPAREPSRPTRISHQGRLRHPAAPGLPPADQARDQRPTGSGSQKARAQPRCSEARRHGCSLSWSQLRFRLWDARRRRHNIRWLGTNGLIGTRQKQSGRQAQQHALGHFHCTLPTVRVARTDVRVALQIISQNSHRLRCNHQEKPSQRVLTRKICDPPVTSEFSMTIRARPIGRCE